ncbi:MAG: DUF554 domain-containing protein [Anaerovoracaceae bacterium]
MLGPTVNAIAIVLCSCVGLGLSKIFSKMSLERFQEIILKAIALAVVYIGLSGAMENQHILMLIFSLVIGGIIGELFDIDKGMNNIGIWAEKKLGFGKGDFSKGFVSASILYCTGSMAIVGAMDSGLVGDNEMLFAKAILDGVISIVFAYQMGIGVAFAAIPVFIYEGAIALAATFVSGWLTAEIITEMSAVGSLLIAAIGFNFLGIKEIKVANLIPAIFLPWVFIGVGGLF